MDGPKLVAHRGYAAQFPENTLLAMQAAIDTGAYFLECDIQLSADHVPILFHDANLERTTTAKGDVRDMAWAELKKIKIDESSRLGDQDFKQTIPSLSELVEMLELYPHVVLFAEIKEESLQRFGTDFVVARILDELAIVAKQVVMISYDASALHVVKRLSRFDVGLVLRKWNQACKDELETLQPEYVICNYQKVIGRLWPGPWRWMCYEFIEPDLAMKWSLKGVEFIETMDCGRLLQDSRLNPHATS
ncbi:MAG: glycerophosphodiester phosphodiesterase family protein [Gammaproteobacteria bacterium]|nr:glycerophosphodiester phosphodiesterase family protein [Gammaproteobacteria bacterium]